MPNEGSEAVAIFHMSIQVVSRGKGKSAVAAAAYRAGEKIKNEYDGMIHDYTRKGGVVHTEILLSENAPYEYANRSILWNAVEKSERYKTAQLAREIEIALPVELPIEQNISLVHRYINEQFVRAGMCADIAIHDTGEGNPHAHIMLTMRPIEKDGKWGQKSRTECGKKVPTVNWNDHDRAEDWRKAWAAYCNSALRVHGSDAVIDHRSYTRQGIDQIPTVHMGVAASQMERKGIRTERGDINRAIGVSNSELKQLKARIVKLQKWLDEEMASTETPTLADVMQSIFDRKAKEGKSSTSQSIYNIKDASRMLLFLSENKIQDMAGLDNHFKGMIGRQSDIRGNLKTIDRRVKTLDEHLRQSAVFKSTRKYRAQYEKLYANYEALKKDTGFIAGRKAQKALAAANEYRESHKDEIASYEAAEKYLKNVLQELFDPKKQPPVSMWTAEREKKLAERSAVTQEYTKLNGEVGEAERIRSRVHSIMRQEQQTTQRLKGKEL